MAEFTLLKLELDGDSFTAAPFGGETDDEREETDEGSVPLGALAVGVLFLLALALAARKLAGGSEDPVEAGDLT